MALTTVAALGTAEFRNLIEAEMLTRPDNKYIWRDGGFVRTYGDADGIASVNGTNYGRILVDKPQFFGDGYSETVRRLTDGTDVDVANILGLGFDQYQIDVREYGGPYGTAVAPSVRPIGVTEFSLRRSIHDLAALVGNGLRRDYERWLNSVFRDMALGTTAVVTADAAQAEGALIAGKKISWEMLTRLKKALEDLLIEPFGGSGNYRFILNTTDSTNLLNDADIKGALKTVESMQAEFRGGYIGSALGFDFMKDTTLPTKGVGAGAAVVAQQGFAYGATQGIGYVDAMGANPRRYNNDDFQRKALFIWVAHQGFGPLDLSNAGIRTLTT